MAKTLLVIDDSKTIQKVFSLCYYNSDVEPVAAMSAQEGVNLAREVRPNAVMVDVSLPDRDGMELLSALRSDPALARTPLVAMAWIKSPVTEDEVKSRGAFALLGKPFDSQVMYDTVEKALAAAGSVVTAAPAPAPEREVPPTEFDEAPTTIASEPEIKALEDLDLVDMGASGDIELMPADEDAPVLEPAGDDLLEPVGDDLLEPADDLLEPAGDDLLEPADDLAMDPVQVVTNSDEAVDLGQDVEPVDLELMQPVSEDNLLAEDGGLAADDDLGIPEAGAELEPLPEDELGFDGPSADQVALDLDQDVPPLELDDGRAPDVVLPDDGKGFDFGLEDAPAEEDGIVIDDGIVVDEPAGDLLEAVELEDAGAQPADDLLEAVELEDAEVQPADDLLEAVELEDAGAQPADEMLHTVEADFALEDAPTEGIELAESDETQEAMELEPVALDQPMEEVDAPLASEEDRETLVLPEQDEEEEESVAAFVSDAGDVALAVPPGEEDLLNKARFMSSLKPKAGDGLTEARVVEIVKSLLPPAPVTMTEARVKELIKGTPASLTEERVKAIVKAMAPAPAAPVAASAGGVGEARVRELISKSLKELPVAAIEAIAWEVVPELAERIIQRELDRLIESRT